VLCLFVLSSVIRTARFRINAIIRLITVVVTVLVVVDLVASSATPILKKTPGTTARASATGGELGSVTRADGGSITTPLGYGIAVAKNSSLHREWIAMHNPRLPVDLEGTPGITTVYERKDYGGGYLYRAPVTLRIDTTITAVTINFLTFDLWGNHVRTLSLTEVSDMKPRPIQLVGNLDGIL